jgi:tetratricopeptide (TPR) repeat protein
LGFFDEAIQYSTKALSLDPLHPTVVAGHIGNFSYAHRFEEAEKVLNDYELSLRDFHTYYYVKGFFYINQGDFARAITTFRTYDSLNAIRPAKVLSLFCKAKLGDRKATENFLRTIPPTLENSVDLAVLYAGLGDKDNCIKYLNLGADNGYIPEYLKVSPLFSFLRSDPRFRALLKKLGLNDPVNMVIEP